MTPSFGSAWFYPSLNLPKSLLKMDVSTAGWWWWWWWGGTL